MRTSRKYGVEKYSTWSETCIREAQLQIWHGRRTFVDRLRERPGLGRRADEKWERPQRPVGHLVHQQMYHHGNPIKKQ